MVLNGKLRVPGFASEPASEPTDETFTKKIGLAAGTHGLGACAAGIALIVAVREVSQMSSPALHPSVGGELSQKLFAAVIVIGLEASVARSFCVLQEITFPPALPAEPPPRSPPATLSSTPKPLPVMTLFSTLLPTPPLAKARSVPEPEPPLSTIRFPVITWLVETSTYTPH